MHLRHIVAGKLKKNSSKIFFKKLNEHLKNLQVKQENIIKKHNSLAKQYEKWSILKVIWMIILLEIKHRKRNQLLVQLRSIRLKIRKTKRKERSNQRG